MSQSSVRYLAKYHCVPCDIKWKLRNTTGGLKFCEKCRKIVFPYKTRPISYEVSYSCQCGNTWKVKCTEKESERLGFCKMCRAEVKPANKKNILPMRRMFGEFHCSDCLRNWFSGNAWPGKGQQCKSCHKMIQAKSLRPLEGHGRATSGPPHQQAYCEMCQKLGYNCRGYRPPSTINHEDDEDDDDQSVLTDTSFSTNSYSSGGDPPDLDDLNITPVPSDDEDATDANLTRMMARFKMK